MESRLGTAEWEDLDVFVERHRYENGDFWIGRSPKTGEPLGYSDDRHVFLASKSRSGKGTTTIINNLLTWKGSMVVVDPKGENATVTAARRGSGSAYCEGMGQRVFVLDPFGSSSVDEKYRASFNPLDALDPTSKSVIDDAGLIADAIIPERPDAKDPYFDLTARKMLKGLILHVITAPHFEGRRNLMTVRALIRHGERDGLEKLKAFRAIRENDSAKRRPLPSAFQLLWSDVAANDALEGIIAGIGESISNSSIEASKTFDNCLSTLDRHSEFLDSFEMRKVLERSDFRLADLKTDPGGVSLYLCLPQRYTTEHYRWLRLMNTLVITMMEEVKEQPATGHRILMVLDEFLLLEHMKVIERAVPYIAGYGLTMFFVVQSLEHLKKVYRETWETLIANCGIKMFYAVGDHFSRKYISDLIGETEVIRETEGWSEQQGTSESSTQGENRSRTDGISESSAEGRSRSEGQTEQRSSTHGTSQNVSDAVSETRGWSDGESSSKSWNKQRSFTRGTSSNESDGYTPSKLLFRNTERHFHLLRENENKGFSFGKNKGSTFGRSFGRSRSMNSGRSGSKSLSRTTTGGTSHSETSGTSQSITNSESLTETTGRSSSETIGENQSTTEGSSITTGKSGNQTVHKRPLITADEIGRWFARPEPTSNDPAWGLIIIDDSKPAVVHRTEYYTDRFFGWLFDPHPDHSPPPKLFGETRFPFPKMITDLAAFAKIDWVCKPGSVVDRADHIGWIDLPGPKELVNTRLVQLVNDTPKMAGISLNDRRIRLALHSPHTGEVRELYEHQEPGIDDTDRLGTLFGNNRQWLLESEYEDPIPSPIEDYSAFCERLFECESLGHRIEQQRIATERRAAEQERARLAEIERKRRESERDRIEQQKREQEEEERRAREREQLLHEQALDRAKARAHPQPIWMSEPLIGLVVFAYWLLLSTQLANAVGVHWAALVFFVWFSAAPIYGIAHHSHIFLTTKHRQHADRHWDSIQSDERSRRVTFEIERIHLEQTNIAELEHRFKPRAEKIFVYSYANTCKLVGFLLCLVIGTNAAFSAWDDVVTNAGSGYSKRVYASISAFLLSGGLIYAVAHVVSAYLITTRRTKWDRTENISKEEKEKRRAHELAAARRKERAQRQFIRLRQEKAASAQEKYEAEAPRRKLAAKKMGRKHDLIGILSFFVFASGAGLIYNHFSPFDPIFDGIAVAIIGLLCSVIVRFVAILLLQGHYYKHIKESELNPPIYEFDRDESQLTANNNNQSMS